MSLDIKEIYRTRNTEEDGGISMGTGDMESRVHLGESHASMSYSSSNIHLNANGIEVTGGTFSIKTPLEDVIFNSIYSLNPELMSGLPSTMVSPIPVLKPTFYKSFSGILNQASIVKDLFG